MSDQAATEQKAAEWLMRRTEPEWSDGDEESFLEWIEQSFSHAAAFWRLEHGYEQLERLSIVPPAPEAQPAPHRIPRFGRLTAIAASLVAVLMITWLVVGSPAVAPRESITTYATNVGQISTVEFPDGSTVSLNSDSRVRLLLEGSKRLAWVDRGEAYIEVAHDPRRSFQVFAGAARITVVGTKFSVIRRPATAELSVVEGKVRLGRASRPQTGSVILSAGEVGTVDAASLRLRTVDLLTIQNSLAWRDGKVIFENTPVEEATEQFNRYNRRKLVVADDAAKKVRIGGTFRLGNVDGFARLMKEAYGLEIVIKE